MTKTMDLEQAGSFLVNDNVRCKSQYATSSLLGFVGSLSILLLLFLIFSPYFNSSLWFYAVWQQLPLGEALLILKDG